MRLVSEMSGKLLVEHGQLIVRKYTHGKNDKVGRVPSTVVNHPKSRWSMRTGGGVVVAGALSGKTVSTPFADHVA